MTRENRLSRAPTGRGRSIQGGVSLVELMIALVLGLLVTAAVYQMFIANQRTSRMQEALSRVQENGRLALEMISRDLRQAGYRGDCSGETDTRSHLDTGSADYDATLFEIGAGLEGWNNQGGSQAASLVDYVPGTDVMIIKHAATATGATLDGDADIDQASIKVKNASDVPHKAILVLADIDACDIFQRTNDNDSTSISRDKGGKVSSGLASPNNIDPSKSFLRKAYDETASIMRLESSLYYIGGKDGDGALRRRSYTLGAEVQDEELIEGVADMQIRYGVDTNEDGQVDDYVVASSGAINGDWSNVRAARVNLLLRADSPNVMPAPVSLAFDGGTFTAAADDLRLYQVFTTTVGLRNRLP